MKINQKKKRWAKQRRRMKNDILVREARSRPVLTPYLKNAYPSGYDWNTKTVTHVDENGYITSTSA